MTFHADIVITGNVVADPDLRYTQNGHAVANFSVAVNYRRKVGDEWEDDPSFFRVTAWRDLAENVCESLAKGDRVIITGRPKQRTWETDEGDKRSVVEIEADDVGMALRWRIVTEHSKGVNAKSKATDGPRGDDRPPPEAYDEPEPF